jgi:hypothetical protein
VCAKRGRVSREEIMPLNAIKFLIPDRYIPRGAAVIARGIRRVS